jgi:hypothetical protein
MDMGAARLRRGAWRSRWAALGAAVAVTAGAGGLMTVGAEGAPSSFVPIEPVRVLDTRNGVDVGLPGPFTSPAPQDLDVTGMIPTTSGSQIVVPDGATGVSLNVTVINATANGFVSVRPADAPGGPTTSNLNFSTGDILPNAVIVAVPTVGADAGRIEISYDAYGKIGPTTDILVDVVGYYVPESFQPVWAGIASGQMIVGNGFLGGTAAIGSVLADSIDITGVAVVPLTSATASFAPDAIAATTDDDPACTGTFQAPTAPQGRFCAYAAAPAGVKNVSVNVLAGIVLVAAEATAVGPAIGFTWAYTAP